MYATPVSVAHVQNAHADVVVRLNRQALPLFDLTMEKPLDVLRLFRPLKVGQAQSWSTRIKRPGGGWIAGRLIAIKRSAAATRKAQHRLKSKASKAQRKVSRASWNAAQYFYVWTTLPETFSTEAVLELYRMRWRDLFSGDGQGLGSTSSA